MLAVLEHELAAVDRQRRDVAPEVFEGKPEVEKRANRHVAADPGERVEIRLHWAGCIARPANPQASFFTGIFGV